MSLPRYPLPSEIGYQEIGVAPTDNTIVRKAANGRIVVNDIGAYSDTQIEILHPYITLAEVNRLLQFWSDTRGQDFYWYDGLRKTWKCSFIGKPTVMHFSGTLYNVQVRFIRRDELEND